MAPKRPPHNTPDFRQSRSCFLRGRQLTGGIGKSAAQTKQCQSFLHLSRLKDSKNETERSRDLRESASVRVLTHPFPLTVAAAATPYSPLKT